MARKNQTASELNGGDTEQAGEVKTRKQREPRIKVDANSSKGQLLEFVNKLTDAESQALRSKLKTFYKDASESEDEFLKEIHNNTRVALGIA